MLKLNLLNHSCGVIPLSAGNSQACNSMNIGQGWYMGKDQSLEAYLSCLMQQSHQVYTTELNDEGIYWSSMALSQSVHHHSHTTINATASPTHQHKGECMQTKKSKVLRV